MENLWVAKKVERKVESMAAWMEQTKVEK